MSLNFLCPAVYQPQTTKPSSWNSSPAAGSREKESGRITLTRKFQRISPFVEEGVDSCVQVSCWVWVFQTLPGRTRSQRPTITLEGSDGVVKAEVPSKCLGCARDTSIFGLGHLSGIMMQSVFRLLEEEIQTVETWDQEALNSLLPYESKMEWRSEPNLQRWRPLGSWLCSQLREG